MLTDNGDSYETLFVISMCQVTQLVPPNRISQQQARQPHFQPQGKKRGLEEDEESISRHSSTPQEPTPANNAGGNVNGRTPGSVVRKKPLKAAVRTERSLNSPLTERSRSSPWSHRGTPMFGNGSMPPPSAVPAWALDQNPRTPQRSQRSHLAGEAEAGPSRDQMKEPLFLPSSQLSQVDKQALKESGLGIENMNREEFMAMLDDEGEEVRVFPRDLHVEGDISMDVREDGEAQGGGEVEIDGRLPEWDELEKFDETGEHETQYEYSQGLGEDKVSTLCRFSLMHTDATILIPDVQAIVR